MLLRWIAWWRWWVIQKSLLDQRLAPSNHNKRKNNNSWHGLKRIESIRIIHRKICKGGILVEHHHNMPQKLPWPDCLFSNSVRAKQDLIQNRLLVTFHKCIWHVFMGHESEAEQRRKVYKTTACLEFDSHLLWMAWVHLRVLSRQNDYLSETKILFTHVGLVTD